MHVKPAWIPRAILAFGVLHVVSGATVFHADAAREMARDGVVNTLGDDPAREAATWFLASGMATLALGDVARTTLRRTGRLPDHLGGWLLAIGVPLVVVEPATGAWSLVAVGAIARRAARRAPAGGALRTSA